jgi:hypothetical protein
MPLVVLKQNGPILPIRSDHQVCQNLNDGNITSEYGRTSVTRREMRVSSS